MANTNLNWPQCPFIDDNTKQPSRPWLLWLQNPSVNSISTNTPLGAIYGGTDNDTSPEDGELLIGNGGTGYNVNRLTAGTGITIVNSPGNIAISSNLGLTPGTYGSASQVPVFVVNALGNLASVTNTTIAISASQISGNIPASQLSGTVAIINGGTGASTASGARTNLGLGTIATQNVGISATITTAKLTTGGATGSMTFVNGILTAQSQAT